MARIHAKEPSVTAIPVAEGVQVEFGTATACAVRNERRDISIRVRQDSKFFAPLFEKVPFVRGIARLFRSFAHFFAALNNSEGLRPQVSVRGGGFSRQFAHLFQTTPQTLAAGLSALAIPIILFSMLMGLPGLAEWGLSRIPDLPRFAVNAACCIFRILGALLSVFLICRLRILNRLCMYRGAAGKVTNAYLAYGPNLTEETIARSSRLTDRSSGAFLILVVLLSIIAFALTPTVGIALQLTYRIGCILLIAAVVNEIIRPLEAAGPNSRLAALRAPLCWLQNLFTIEPGKPMIEVALYAFQAAYDNDVSHEDHL